MTSFSVATSIEKQSHLFTLDVESPPGTSRIVKLGSYHFPICSAVSLYWLWISLVDTSPSILQFLSLRRLMKERILSVHEVSSYRLTLSIIRGHAISLFQTIPCLTIISVIYHIPNFEPTTNWPYGIPR